MNPSRQAVPSWFVHVEAIKPALLANNAKTRWVPAYVQEKRFHNWLENARDWVGAGGGVGAARGWQRRQRASRAVGQEE